MDEPMVSALVGSGGVGAWAAVLYVLDQLISAHGERLAAIEARVGRRRAGESD